MTTKFNIYPQHAIISSPIKFDKEGSSFSDLVIYSLNSEEFDRFRTWTHCSFIFFFHIHTFLEFIWKFKRFLLVFLKKSPRWLLTSSSTFETSVLELPVSKFLQIFFHRLLIVSSFLNNKHFHKNQSGRRLKLRKTKRKSHFWLIWPV